MERKKFLEMCREISVLPDGIAHIKDPPDRLLVVYNGSEYYPVKYELAFDNKGNATHTAVIHELRANAWWYVPLDKVEENK